VSFLLYLFGIVNRKDKNQRKRQAGKAIRDGTDSVDAEKGESENLFQLPEMQPLMERIDKLQEKQRNLETDENVQEYLDRHAEKKDSMTGNEEEGESSHNASQKIDLQQQAAPQIPVEVYTRQLRSMISNHLDRVQRPREYQAYLAQPKPLVDSKTRKYDVSAFIQEYSEKEQQFLAYCEKLLQVVDEKGDRGHSSKRTDSRIAPNNESPGLPPNQEGERNAEKKVSFREPDHQQSPWSGSSGTK